MRRTKHAPRHRPRRSSVLYQRIAVVERAEILAALRDTTVPSTWNVKAAARVLGLPLSTMKWKMARYKIRRPK